MLSTALLSSCWAELLCKLEPRLLPKLTLGEAWCMWAAREQAMLCRLLTTIGGLATPEAVQATTQAGHCKCIGLIAGKGT